jgi:metal-responsive CopG/Arc/MetJ family transcriptional regulator
MARTTQNVCLTLPPETLAKVDRAARSERRSRSQFINLVLERAVENPVALRRETSKQELENAQ